MAKDTWRILSSDLLLPEDATDPTNGEMPNDSAVIDLLLKRGKYSVKDGGKKGARGYGGAYKKFAVIEWPSHGTGRMSSA